MPVTSIEIRSSHKVKPDWVFAFIAADYKGAVPRPA
jgi:hypothetical protein